MMETRRAGTEARQAHGSSDRRLGPVAARRRRADISAHVLGALAVLWAGPTSAGASHAGPPELAPEGPSVATAHAQEPEPPAGAMPVDAQELEPSAGAASPDAQEPEPSSVHPEAREAIRRLWSPYCPGLMLEVCPSSGGEMLRDSIESLARSGVGADSIVELVVAEYGERYRAVPQVEGVGGLAWYVPPLALIAGLAAVALFLARRRAAGRPAATGPPPSEADEERLRQAMAELDEDERPDF